VFDLPGDDDVSPSKLGDGGPSSGTTTADLSVLTLVRNRNAMLARLVAGLVTAERPPTELVVAWCGGEDPHGVVESDLPFDVRVIEVGTGGERIPYSHARNECARTARSQALAFLDADCIPGSRYPGALADALAQVDALCTGEVWYLPPDTLTSFAEADLRRIGRPHPHRERPPSTGIALSSGHELVWGLHMAVRRSTFDGLGGFDESYQGYAGEDTDLAVAARSRGVPVALVAGADVFHQHHDVWEPPVQQLEATLANARRFHEKWGRWPMEGWLVELVDLGLIEWSLDGPTVRLLRQPDDRDLARAHRASALPFRTQPGERRPTTTG